MCFCFIFLLSNFEAVPVPLLTNILEHFVAKSTGVGSYSVGLVQLPPPNHDEALDQIHGETSFFILIVFEQNDGHIGVGLIQ